MSISLPHSVVATKDIFTTILKLVQAEPVTWVVVWEASWYDATGKQMKKFSAFQSQLRKELNTLWEKGRAISTFQQDEDLSTFEAQEALWKLWGKDHVDDVAAAIILQRFLDNQF